MNALNRRLTLMAIRGLRIDQLPNDLDWGSCYPVVDPDTLRVYDIVDGNYPNELADGNWSTASLVDGKILVGQHYYDFAVENERVGLKEPQEEFVYVPKGMNTQKEEDND